MQNLFLLLPFANAPDTLSFQLEKYFKLQHEVVHAEWSDATKKWTIQVKRPDGTILVDEADVFINAGGEFSLLEVQLSTLGVACIRFL